MYIEQMLSWALFCKHSKARKTRLLPYFDFELSAFPFKKRPVLGSKQLNENFDRKRSLIPCVFSRFIDHRNEKI
jgi:hypothetical protein